MTTGVDAESLEQSIPDVSIVVVNWNTRELTLACLASVIEATVGCRYELIVVDNGSDDGSVEAIRERFPDLPLLCNDDNLGFARACNQGLRRATGRHLLLLNSDTLLESDAVTRLLEELEGEADIGMVGAKLLYPDGRLQPSCGRFPTVGREVLGMFNLGEVWRKLRQRGREFPQPFQSQEVHLRAGDVDWVAGACMLVRREVVESVGMLDESIFLFAEEWDWCFRIQAAGWRVRHQPDASLVHIGSASMSDDANWRVRALLDGYHCFHAKHHGRLAAVGFAVVTAVASSLKSLLWGGLTLVLSPHRKSRQLCARRLTWNLHSVAWACRSSTASS